MGRRSSPNGGRLGVHEPQASARPALVRAQRLYLAATTSEVLIVLASWIAAAGWHIVPALNAAQILAIDLLVLILPAVAAGWDYNLGRPRPASSSALTPASFGCLAGALAYANYWLFFTRHHLSAAYLDPNLPLYHQATTLVFLTLALCLYVHLLFERSDKYKSFFTHHLWSNSRLLAAFAVSLLFMGNIVYNPFIQHFFGAGSLSWQDCLTALAGAIIYGAFRLLQRHTRKHSRQAVLKLHRQARA